MIRLTSFDIRVQGSEQKGYTIEATGPAGERVGPLAFDREAVAALEPDLEAILARRAEPGTLQRVGKGLFQALFPLDVLMVYGAVKNQTATGQGQRLRLELPSELARLPWELLHYPPHFIAVSPLSPVVRFLPLPDTPRPLTVPPPLRLLHLAASPENAPELDAEREGQELRQALAELEDRVEILNARPGTLASLRDGLREGCHILHFSGHGGLAAREGYLLFEDEQGRGKRVSAATLAHMLLGSNVRLAVLNACQSAAFGVGDALSSVAGALVHAGLPAVVAHQAPMPDHSAIALAGGLYRALADGYPIDAAVGEGRAAVIASLPGAWQDRFDWAAPVLLMRAPDGQILGLEEKGTEASAPGVQQNIIVLDDATTIGTVSGGTVNIDFGGGKEEEEPPAPEPEDTLTAILAELEHTVRAYAPTDKQSQAIEKVAALKGAATDPSPDLDLLESVRDWFKAEIPALSGPALSAILGFEDRVDEHGLRDFRQRFLD